jgi:hypothetical protein
LQGRDVERNEMTDRELLELAAKAAGIEINWFKRERLTGQWNPLTDDGDALRLAVKLLFEIDMGRGSIAIRHATGIKILEAFNQNPYAATRRAITRAAAEIGKGMP